MTWMPPDSPLHDPVNVLLEQVKALDDMMKLIEHRRDQ
jgi:hypothetical protein